MLQPTPMNDAGKQSQAGRQQAAPVSRPAPASTRPAPDGSGELDADFVLACLQDEEEGDARLFAHVFAGQCVYDHTDGLWYEWQGNYWQRDACNHLLLLASGPLAAVYLHTSAVLSEQAARVERVLPSERSVNLLSKADPEVETVIKRLKWLQSMANALFTRAGKLKRLTRAENVLKYARAMLPIEARQWDTNPWLLGTAEGVIDLRTGELRPGQPTDYIRTIIPTRFEGLDAPAPRFEQFLHEIFADRAPDERQELLDFLQRALGYGITGKVSEHLFLVLYGEEGRNGKDTLISTLQAVLGASVGAVSNDVLLAGSKFSAPGAAKPHLCSLQGKRLAWASETDRGARFDVGQVKYLTGGGSIAARQLYGRDFTFEPSHLLILLTNHKPHADASDAAFWERLCPILFNLRFVEHPSQPNERQRDTRLVEALQAEASGILAWLLRGALAWQQHGLHVPASIRQARASYREEEDTLGEFLRACCTFDERASVGAGQLYTAYKEWTTENGLKYVNSKVFGMDMKKRMSWAHKETGIIYLGLALQGGQWLKGQCAADKSFRSAPQANLGHIAPSKTEGTEGTFQKVPLVNQENAKTESFPKVPSVPSAVPDFAQGENGVNLTEKPREFVQEGGIAQVCDPSADGAVKSDPVPVEESDASIAAAQDDEIDTYILDGVVYEIREPAWNQPEASEVPEMPPDDNGFYDTAYTFNEELEHLFAPEEWQE